MRTLGLIGFPLTHSFSVSYFADKFKREGIADCEYRNFPIESIEELSTLLKTETLSGLNVTIPYKEAVIEYLDELDRDAEAIGAVNCIKFSDGRLKGYNTDVFGFRESLKKFLNGAKLKALILGTGGSSKAIAFALDQLHIPYKFVSRRKKAEWFTYRDLTQDIISEHKLIINTSPIGMFPHNEEMPELLYEYLTPAHYLYDLIYNPDETAFLSQGAMHGSHIKNGLEMLHLQAEKNWEIWNAA
jgi:shikimate dehydrogenase